MNHVMSEPVLDHGIIELQSVMGSDLDAVNAAKVSFASYESEMSENAKGLINYLIKNRHATPFEHIVFKFYVKAPIFVAREWFRHRWSSFNEMSMRYHTPKKLDFYVPERDAIRTQTGKPGAYTFETISNDDIAQETVDLLDQIYKIAEENYQEMLRLGIAKEIARCVLPVGMYTEFIWTVNARSLMNFLSLRNEEHAQYEIAEYAKLAEYMFSKATPVIYASWVENGRNSI